MLPVSNIICTYETITTHSQNLRNTYIIFNTITRNMFLLLFTYTFFNCVFNPQMTLFNNIFGINSSLLQEGVTTQIGHDFIKIPSLIYTLGYPIGLKVGLLLTKCRLMYCLNGVKGIKHLWLGNMDNLGSLLSFWDPTTGIYCKYMFKYGQTQNTRTWMDSIDLVDM